MSSSYDAIVIGAGHNGMACAILLARAGKKVLVVEQREDVGGLCAPRRFHEGFTAPGVLHDTSEIRQGLCDSLGLFGQGLKMRQSAPPIFAPQKEGPGLLLERDPARAAAEIKAHSAADADAYQELMAFLARVRPVIEDALNREPPPLMPEGAGELIGLGLRGLAVRRLGKDDMYELIRILPTCVADWIREQFETELLSATLAGGTLLGAWAGPWSAGTTASLLLSESVRGPGVEGGPAAVGDALGKALRAANVELRTTAEIAHIRVAQGCVRGVTLASGEQIDAPLVASAACVRRTLLDMVPPAELPLDVEREASHFRSRGVHAKVHLALSGPLSFRGREGELFEHVRIGEHLDDLERAFDAIKYRRFSDVPHLDIRVPTVSSPELAPEGKHVASIIVSFAPWDLEIGWSPETREALLDTVLETLEAYAPGASELVEGSEVLAPPDLETEFGLTQGHLYGGEHALDQLLFMRPGPGLARYATPLEGLYLAGTGTHPGGGVTLAAGALAAKAILG